MEENISETQSVGILVQPTPPHESVKRKPWLKIIFFSVLALIFAGGLVFAGYWYGKNSNLKTQKSKLQLKTQNLTPTLPPVVSSPTTIPPEATLPADEAAGWKSYTSPDRTYSFKYPSDWFFVEGKADAGPFVVVRCNEDYPGMMKSCGKPGDTVGSFSAGKSFFNSVDEYIEHAAELGRSDYVGTTFNGDKAVKAVGWGGVYAPLEIEFFVVHKEKGYSLKYGYAGPIDWSYPPKPRPIVTLEQVTDPVPNMLSTFRFVE